MKANKTVSTRLKRKIENAVKLLSKCVTPLHALLTSFSGGKAETRSKNHRNASKSAGSNASQTRSFHAK